MLNLRKCLLVLLMSTLVMSGIIVGPDRSQASGSKLVLSESMISNVTDQNQSSKLFDEQSTAGDPRNGNGGAPATVWSPSSTPGYVFIDLGEEYNISDIYLYNKQLGTSGNFQVYTSNSIGSWTYRFNESSTVANQWKGYSVQYQARYVRFVKQAGSASIAEVVLYGSPVNGGVDSSAPSAVTNLAASNPTASSIQLNWTAPQDLDGNNNIVPAASYDIRYSTAPITSGNWSSATQVSGEPAPATPGSSQSMTVGGLASSTTYYFALRSVDGGGNVSAISNLNASASTLIGKITLTTGMVHDVSGTGVPSRLTDEQSVAGDPRGSAGGAPTTVWSPTAFPAYSYIDLGEEYNITDIYLYTKQLKTTGNFQVYTASTLGSWTFRFNESSTAANQWKGYNVQYQARYVRFIKQAGSANIAEVVLYGTPVNGNGGTDGSAPSAVTNLSAGNPTASSIQLTWTAPQDLDANNNVVPAASYDIRYSTSPITSGNWSSASQASGEPAPATPGSSESMTVGGLSPTTTYYFALKSTDASNNVSGLSNLNGSATTTGGTGGTDTTPPNTVSSLSITAMSSFYTTLSWSAPSDLDQNNQVQTAASYDIRYSTALITTGNWDDALPIPFEPDPATPNQSQSMTFSSLDAGTRYYFAMKTKDASGNVSALSNVVNDWTDTLTCDYTIESGPAGAQSTFNGITSGSTPIYGGEVVCIEGYSSLGSVVSRGRLSITNVKGQPDAPVLFVNNGIVSIQGTVQGITAVQSEHFRISGSGPANVGDGYGIRIHVSSHGVQIKGKSSYMEVDNLYISQSSIGIGAKSDLTCYNYDEQYGSGFKQRNTIVRNNKIVDASVEGVYIGDSHLYGKNNIAGCPNTVYPHVLEGVRIHDNIVDQTGWDGIQIGAATEDVEVYSNTVTNFATESAGSHSAGIQINPGTTGLFYNNTIKYGAPNQTVGKGIEIQSRGDLFVFNNLIVNPGLMGIYSKGVALPGTPEVVVGGGIHILNNTVINPAAHFIRIDNDINQGNTLYNNILVYNGTLPIDFKKPVQQFWDIGSENLFTTSSGAPGFVNYNAENYRLSSGSSYKDSGRDLTSEGVLFDLDGNVRPQGSGFSIGAYEN